MTGLELYKFINENQIEWHKSNNEGTPDVLIFPYSFQMEELYKLLAESIFDDGGIEVYWKGKYFAIWMKNICEYCGIDMDQVFVGEEGNC